MVLFKFTKLSFTVVILQRPVPQEPMVIIVRSAVTAMINCHAAEPQVFVSLQDVNWGGVVVPVI